MNSNEEDEEFAITPSSVQEYVRASPSGSVATTPSVIGSDTPIKAVVPGYAERIDGGRFPMFAKREVSFVQPTSSVTTKRTEKLPRLE
jgi:hypothetical protein